MQLTNDKANDFNNEYHDGKTLRTPPSVLSSVHMLLAKFWGVRGSYPVPGATTNRYGGQTACVEVRPEGFDDNEVLIIDAGTGIRKLGQKLVKDFEKYKIHLLISHTHWDHIQGFPFFAPLYQKENSIHVYARQRQIRLEDIFSEQTKAPFFSAKIEDVDAEVSFHELVEGTFFSIKSASVCAARLNHPYIAVGYRVETKAGTLAYICDTAPFDRILLEHEFVGKMPTSQPDADDTAILSAMKEGVVALCKEADLVIYDTMFSLEEYERYPHWGHSAPEHALLIAEEAKAKCLAFYHYHPNRSDDDIDNILLHYQKELQDRKVPLKLIAAKEGMSVYLDKGNYTIELDEDS